MALCAALVRSSSGVGPRCVPWRRLASTDAVARLIILGAPGSGKGTHKARLEDRYALRSLVVGDLLRAAIRAQTPLGQKVDGIMRQGGLVEDEDVAGVVEPEVVKLKGHPWIIDGFPRKASQAKILDDMLERTDDPLTMVVFIDVPDEVILQRIEDRWVHLPSGRTYNLSYNPPKESGKDDVTGEPLGKRDYDNAEVFAARLKRFRAENEPLLDYYRDQDARRAAGCEPLMLTFSGETSDIIFPQLHDAFRARFPGTPRV